MKTTDKRRRLADEILSCFREGITIDGHTRRYIDSCLPGMGLEDVAHRIGDIPDMDAAPLMDLIFFPDEALQARLEPLLEKEMFDSEDEAGVVALLEAEAIYSELRETGSPGAAALCIPAAVLAPFVRRLGITRRLPPRLADAISRAHPPETATRLKVMLRNTRFSFSRPVIDFLNVFLMGMAPGDPAFAVCFESTLALLEAQDLETDPIRLLRSKTETLYRARDAAARFEKQLLRNNMETLMHQGVRAPEISVAEAEDKIAVLDRIGRAVALGGYLARLQG